MNPVAEIENLCFFDTETRACKKGVSDDVKDAGSYRYNKNAFVIVSTWAIGNGAPFEVSLDRGFDGDWLCWDEMPRELHEFHKRVEQGEAWYAAWNAGFDWRAWNDGTYDFPQLVPGQYIDVLAQAAASCLPAKLEGASQTLLGEGKQEDGKQLINMFSPADGATPFNPDGTLSAAWLRFKSYGLTDTVRLRQIFERTRPLPLAEWEDYWVNERINARGQAIDLAFAERAAAISALNVKRMNREIAALTEGKIKTVNQTVAIAEWAYGLLSPIAREILVKSYDEEAEPDEFGELVPDKLGIDRGRIERVLAHLKAAREADRLTNSDAIVEAVLMARQFGGSTSPKKFAKMLAQHDDGRLKGQYVFNGANQTGRYSARGVQVHNLTRSSLGKMEPVAINLINELEI